MTSADLSVADTRRSLWWSGGAFASTALLNFAVLFVLARLLPPGEMALVFIAILFQDLMLLWVDSGMGSYVIQAPRLSLPERSSLFFQGAVLGLSVAGVLALAAPVLAGFFQSPALADGLRVTALGFIPVALAFPQKALIQKALRFKAIALAEFSGMALGGAVTVWLAFSGYGFSSYLVGFLVRKVLECLVYWAGDPWLPRPVMLQEQVAGLFRYSAYAASGLMLSYAVRLLDTFFIGRLLGAHALGLYAMASNLVYFPVSKCVVTFSRVFVATFSRIRHDNGALCAAFGDALGRLMALLLPGLLTLWVLAPEIVRVAFPPDWFPVASVLRILVLGGLLTALLRLGEPMLLALGRVRTVFVVYGANLLCTAAALALLADRGIEAAAWAVTLSGLPALTLMLLALRHLAVLPARSGMAAFRSLALPLFALLAVLLLARPFLFGVLPPGWALLVLLVLGAAAYAGLMGLSPARSPISKNRDEAT